MAGIEDYADPLGFSRPLCSGLEAVEAGEREYLALMDRVRAAETARMSEDYRLPETAISPAFAPAPLFSPRSPF